MSQLIERYCHTVDRTADRFGCPQMARPYVRSGAVWFGGSFVEMTVTLGLMALGVSNGTMISLVIGAAMSQLTMRAAKPYLPKEWQPDAQRAINFGLVMSISGVIGHLAISGISPAIPALAAAPSEVVDKYIGIVRLLLTGTWYFGPDIAKKAKELYASYVTQPTVE